MKVMAEGVEDESQVVFLRAHKCNEVQGYLFARPSRPAVISGMLAEQARRVGKGEQ